jgi:hypothetical protein
MKEYPSIPRIPHYGVPVYAFDKLDGSNIRAEWRRKKGQFYKYGSRTQLMDGGHPFLGDAIGIIQEKYEEGMCHVFEKNRWHEATAFFEFWGQHSFAGWHVLDEPHDVTLIDVKPFKHGILNPDEFLDLFGHLGTARFIFRGNMNAEVEEEIRSSRMLGITFEGVVCKMKVQGKQQNPEMFKVKTRAWLAKLKEKCGDDQAMFNRLV